MQERPLSSTYRPDTSTLVVSGAIDELSVQAFGEALDEAFGRMNDGVLVIDLSDVDYLPSIAVSALVLATRPDRAARTSEVVAVEGSIAQRVLEICGLPHRRG